MYQVYGREGKKETDAIWGQLRREVPLNGVQLSPAFAKFTAGTPPGPLIWVTKERMKTCAV